MPKGDFSILESYTRAFRGAKRFIYLENQFLWSPRSRPSSPTRSSTRRRTISGSCCSFRRNRTAVPTIPAGCSASCSRPTPNEEGSSPRPLRQVGQPGRPDLRPREGRNRRRRVADDRLCEPERALALQRHGDERGHPRLGSGARDADSPLVGASRAPTRSARGRSDRDHREALEADQLRPARAPGTTGSHPLIASSACRMSRSARAGCSGRSRGSSSTVTRSALDGGKGDLARPTASCGPV